ncbi:MAG: DUF1460 domain-containing protein [Odoribacteraceae bacterium]|jgi:hypothetical protein|nr:DUF1460 domain-containing protein [Odoribacteraceae bacterium]
MKMVLALTVALVVLLQCRGGDTARVAGEDRAVLERYLEHARARRLDTLPVHRRVAETALFFLDTPYRAGTLDDEGPERLVVNLREMDCVTFVDNVLALAMLPPGRSLDRFLDNLRRVRYRDGKIVDFASRLHYSTDWLFEMQRQGILREVEMPGSLPLANKVHYLTRHHPALANDPALRARVAAHEERINARKKQYLPKERVEARAGQLREGDVVLITTGREGLDTSHLGIVVERDGMACLLHASSDARAVVISPVSLRDYLRPVGRHTGIIAARMID